MNSRKRSWATSCTQWEPTNGDIVASSVEKIGSGGVGDTVSYDDFKALKN